ncbi:MAG: hypothetical protein ACRDNK_18265 [Solirubrobacteraceae bacterium]
MARGAQRFDPLGVLAALERHYVSYVLIGGLAQVLRGADLTSTGVDICPSFAKNNLDQLTAAITELDTTASDGRPAALGEVTLTREPVMEVATRAGVVKVIASPAGVPNGYVDLRRAASREDLGHGIRPLVASAGDLAAMAAALHRDRDLERLPALRRIVELDAGRLRPAELGATASQTRPSRAARRGPRATR